MRGVLAGLLFQRPDVLLLDEPTNHLDMPSVAWFGDFLKKWNRCFILISHDREFLNEQISRVVSASSSRACARYPGNYEKYVAAARRGGDDPRRARRRTSRASASG